jgi:hypothetical protein
VMADAYFFSLGVPPRLSTCSSLNQVTWSFMSSMLMPTG